jgi:hypothetical protein
MTNRNTFYRILAVLAVMIPSTIQAGIEITLQGEDGAEVHAFQEGKYALITDGRLETLVDMKAGLASNFDYRNQVFTSVELSQLKDLVKKSLDEKMAILANEPMVQMMIAHQKQEAANTKIEINPIGNKTIQGSKAEGFSIAKNGRVVREMWVSKDLSSSIQKEFDYERYNRILQEVQGLISDTIANDPLSEAEQKVEFKGFLIQASEAELYGPARLNPVKKLSAITTKTLPSSLFSIPEGFREVSFETFESLMEEEEEEDESYDDEDDY